MSPNVHPTCSGVELDDAHRGRTVQTVQERNL